MKQTTVVATFKGQDGSLGFKKGEQYTLIISYSFLKGIKILSYAEGKRLICFYASIHSFLKNWSNILTN